MEPRESFPFINKPPPLSLNQLNRAESRKAPKKLKDVKINPAVAATFANLSIAPPPGAGGSGEALPCAAMPCHAMP